MPDQNERFYIAPVEGKAPPESIVIGPMSEVMEYIGGSIARIEKEKRLALAERDAEETAKFQAEARASAAQMLVDGLEHLSGRIDAYEARKKAHADQQRRDKEEAEAAAIEEMLSLLPDPDNPHAMGDDGDFEAVIPPPDTERHDPEHRNEAATGAMPNELDIGAPPQPGDYTPTLPPPSPYRAGVDRPQDRQVCCRQSTRRLTRRARKTRSLRPRM
jgi:hypothetical protein